MDEIVCLSCDPISDHEEEVYSLAEIIELAKESRLAFKELESSIREGLIKTHPKWLNSYQAAFILNVTGQTLKRYRSLEILPFVVVKGLCKYRYEDVMRLLNPEK